jgi:hypothetical protein
MQFAACCGLLLGVLHGLVALDLEVTPGMNGFLAERQAPWSPSSPPQFGL